MKAFLLAAGRGKRLLPFTLDNPKPLIKIGGLSLIERNIEKLKNCRDLFFYPKEVGCIDSKALNYNPYATTGNRSCIYEINNK